MVYKTCTAHIASVLLINQKATPKQRLVHYHGYTHFLTPINSTSLHLILPKSIATMGLFDFFNGDASGRDFVYNMDPNSEHHKSKLSHELIGGAAGFEAMRAYEQHCQANGQPANVSLLCSYSTWRA